MRDFNTFKWRKNRVLKREDVSTGAHYQAQVFSTRSEWVPRYDHYDDPGGSTVSCPQVDVYAFKTKEELNDFVSDAAQTDAQFVFYAVPGLGKATVKVDVAAEMPKPPAGYRDGYDPNEGNRG